VYKIEKINKNQGIEYHCQRAVRCDLRKINFQKLPLIKDLEALN